MPSALGCAGAAGDVGFSASTHLVPVGWHQSWPTLGVYVST
jgi:hypothetical protein